MNMVSIVINGTSKWCWDKMAGVTFEVKGFDELAKELKDLSADGDKIRNRVLTVGSEEVKESWQNVLRGNIYPNGTVRQSARIRNGKTYRFSYKTRSTGALQQSIDFEIKKDMKSSEIYPKGSVIRNSSHGRKKMMQAKKVLLETLIMHLF